MALIDQDQKILPRLNLSALKEHVVDPLTKGFPLDAKAMPVGDIGAQGWSMLKGDLPLPLAILRGDVLKANSQWMKRFTAENGLEIAPHGKTTMAPQLFDQQIADGAWAMTIATAQQLEVCVKFGVKRIIVANQLIGRQSVDTCFRALKDQSLELYCLADSEAGVALLAEGSKRNPPAADNPLRVFIEIGFTGGRAGARDRKEALAVARAVAATPGLALAGFECFEGLLPDPDSAGGLVEEVAAIAALADEEGLLPPDVPMILTAGGSAFFDQVGERLAGVSFRRPMLKILRSGCYLTHDSIGYAAAFKRIVADTSLHLPEGGLEPALEVWAYVQSRPERGRTILTMGKRDVSYDSSLPVPVKWYRPDGSMERPEAMPRGHVVAALNDQHCHLGTPGESPLQVGDMVGFGIGHPCTTFDKWSLLMMVDEDYRIVEGVKTYF